MLSAKMTACIGTVAAASFIGIVSTVGAEPVMCEAVAQPWMGDYNLTFELPDGSLVPQQIVDQHHDFEVPNRSYEFEVGTVAFVLWAQIDFPPINHASWGDALAVDSESCKWAEGVDYNNDGNHQDSVIIRSKAPEPTTTTTTTVQPTTTTEGTTTTTEPTTTTEATTTTTQPTVSSLTTPEPTPTTNPPSTTIPVESTVPPGTTSTTLISELPFTGNGKLLGISVGAGILLLALGIASMGIRFKKY